MTRQAPAGTTGTADTAMVRDAISNLDSIATKGPLCNLLQAVAEAETETETEPVPVPDLAPMSQETRLRFNALLKDVLASKHEPVVTLYDVLLFSREQEPSPEVMSSLVLKPPCS